FDCSLALVSIDTSIYTSFFFFFQAEDGIRDFHVTGVQTCALPISAAYRRSRLPPRSRRSAACWARCPCSRRRCRRPRRRSPPPSWSPPARSARSARAEPFDPKSASSRAFLAATASGAALEKVVSLVNGADHGPIPLGVLANGSSAQAARLDEGGRLVSGTRA